MKTEFDLQKKKRAVRRRKGLSLLCVGLSLCLLLSACASPEPPVREASVFNGGGAYTAASSLPLTSGKTPTQVIPLGSVFGIRLFTDGVIVASLSEIYTKNGLCCPAEAAGIKPGDYLLQADGKPLVNNSQLAALFGASGGSEVRLTVRRDDKVFEATVTPVYSGGAFRTGMWVRDSAAGIGTLTFYDPDSGVFAGLGHGICDMDVGTVMSLKRGEPAPITLCGVDPGVVGSPGQLRGFFSSEESLGTLLANNETGVYGTLTEAPAGKLMQVLPREKVQCGPVSILATVDSGGPRLYEGEITHIGDVEQTTRNLVIKVTDPRLLAITGGIVQGMSGCPILQNGKLAGAVTHVFTDDPARGYGIFAETMCEQCAARSP